MQRFISGNRFLFAACSVIFLLSILLRSMMDIGPDTGIYLELGRKFSEGGRYYYDFFESNFPISFFIYALEYQLSSLLNIDPIITSEIVVNLLALTSIFWSAVILKGSEIYRNRVQYNLIVIAYFLSFFLRVYALQIGEFGTKSTFLLLLLYPYLSYSFPRQTAFTTKDLIARGCLIGLIPCFKPHYIVFPLIIEIHKFWQRRSLSFFFELDKLFAALIYIAYLFLMLKFTPEFFEMMVPMWMEYYSSYNNSQIFLNNLSRLVAAYICPFSFMFLVFARLKPSESDKVLLAFFCAASALFILESAMTIDQSVSFYAAVTVCFFKLAIDVLDAKKIQFSKNKFILISLFFLPLFDLKIFPSGIFGLSGFINVWWIVAPFFLFAHRAFLIFYLLLLASAVMLLRYYGIWIYVAFNLLSLLTIAFFYEKKIQAKVSEYFSVFTVFLIAASFSSLLYLYVGSVVETAERKSRYTFPNDLSDMMNYYNKSFSPSKDDGLMMISNWNSFAYSRINYFGKKNYQKFHLVSLNAKSGVTGSSMIFRINDLDKIFTNYYLFDDVRAAVRDPRTKLIFVNSSLDASNKRYECVIGSLEYFFLDQSFKKEFFRNFRFENRVIIDHEIESYENIPIITGKEPSVFDQVKKSKRQVLYEFEIYVRK